MFNALGHSDLWVACAVDNGYIIRSEKIKGVRERTNASDPLNCPTNDRGWATKNLTAFAELTKRKRDSDATIEKPSGCLWRTQEAAEYLGTTEGTLRIWCFEKRLYFKIGRSVRFRRSDLDRWIDEQLVPEAKQL